MELVAATLLGVAIGTATGLVPGLHVNTVAAIGLAMLPAAGWTGAVILVAVGTVHTIINILPATYLGLPEEDTILSVLPAHQMVLVGNGPAAVRISVAASLAGAFLAIAAAVAYRRIIEPAMPVLDVLAPWILVAATLWLWFGERRNGWRVILAAAFVWTAAAGLGWIVLATPMAGLVPVPASPLLPLLGGLFGAAGLTFAIGQGRRIPTQNPCRHERRHPIAVGLGTCAAAATAVLPGLTAAVAATLVPGTSHNPKRVIAAMSAVNTAHAIFALVVWMGTGRIRTGLADATDRWVQVAWIAVAPPPTVLQLLAVIGLAAGAGAAATLALDRVLSGRVHRMPANWLAVAGLASLAGLTAIMTGPAGLAALVAATLLGRLPLHLGIRRVHLVGALIGPILIRLL